MTKVISIRPNRESFDYYESVTLIIPGREPMSTRLGNAICSAMRIPDEQNRTAALIARKDKDRMDFEQIRAIYRRADFPEEK